MQAHWAQKLQGGVARHSVASTGLIRGHPWPSAGSGGQLWPRLARNGRSRHRTELWEAFEDEAALARQMRGTSAHIAQPRALHSHGTRWTAQDGAPQPCVESARVMSGRASIVVEGEHDVDAAFFSSEGS